MRTYSILAVIGLLAVAVSVQAQDKGAKPGEKEIRAMELRQRQLGLQERESQLSYQHQVRQLELEAKRVEIEKQRKAIEAPASRPDWNNRMGHRKHAIGRAAFMLVCGLIHILLAIWVFQDIRKRNTGSGIWIIITLLAGLFGVIPYILTRIGDTRQA